LVATVVDDGGTTSSPAFWTILIGSATGILGGLLGRKSRPLDRADTAARIGDAWDRIAVQLTQDNVSLRNELSELRKAEEECRDQTRKMQADIDALQRICGGLTRHLASLGIPPPEDT
jgi:demethoxyubiquinone hydroxylase (CLK1/Coq7/Cat5 family)